MELSCPSCSTKHKTEDYPGAFEIQCSCGYSILVPDESSLQEAPPAEAPPVPSFDDAPMAMDTFEEPRISIEESQSEEIHEISVEQDQFSSLNLTAPDNLPDEMPYDPFELQTQWSQSNEDNLSTESNSAPDSILPPTEVATAKSEAPPPTPSTSKPTTGQEIVNRIQMASIGHVHGSLFDIEIENISEDLQKAISKHTYKFLSQRHYLKEHLSKEFDKDDNIFKTTTLKALPEILAVEIYLYCAQNKIQCNFTLHKET